MLSESIRPSSIGGIKRLAKNLKAAGQIKHAQALDLASQQAGYQNYRHAINQLASIAKPTTNPIGHRVYLTAYWKDRDDNSTGRETLSIWLPAPWGDLISANHFRNHRSLRDLNPEGPDHLEYGSRLSSQAHARLKICQTANTLHFIAATNLQPSKGESRALPRGDYRKAVPGHDHHSIWYDRITKCHIYVDEPYAPAIKDMEQERQDWARAYGFTIAKPNWSGMYAPDIGSQIYLIADESKGISLAPLVEALNMLPAALVPATWSGVSAPISPRFVSPGTLTMEESCSQPKKRSTPKAFGKTVGYVRALVGPERRPNARMPLKAHEQVGLLLKSVIQDTYFRKGAYNRLDSIRSELDEWVQREYTHEELPQEQFLSLYYGGEISRYHRSISRDDCDQHLARIWKIQEILSEHYPDCEPLRALFKKLDFAVTSLKNWADR